jgi:hypothetical protein
MWADASSTLLFCAAFILLYPYLVDGSYSQYAFVMLVELCSRQFNGWDSNFHAGARGSGRSGSGDPSVIAAERTIPRLSYY